MAVGFKTGGRQAGTPNKINGNLRQLIFDAVNHLGGKDYLVTQAIDNPVAFLALLGKVLPVKLQGDRDNPIEITVSLEARRQRARAEIAEAFGEPMVITDAVSVITGSGQRLITDVTNNVPDIDEESVPDNVPNTAITGTR